MTRRQRRLINRLRIVAAVLLGAATFAPVLAAVLK